MRAVTPKRLFLLASLCCGPVLARADVVDPLVGYRLVSVKTGLAISGGDDVSEKGTSLELDGPEGGDDLVWRFVPNGDGGLHLLSKVSGQCASVSREGPHPVSWTCDTGGRQSFVVERATGGFVRLRQKGAKSTLQVVGAKEAADVVIGPPTGTDAELWRLEPAGSADWGDESERPEAKFYAALEAHDLDTARALAEARKGDGRKAWLAVLDLSQGRYEAAWKVTDPLVAASEDIGLMKDLARFFVHTMSGHTRPDDAPRPELNAHGMSYLRRAAELHMKRTKYVQTLDLQPPLKGCFLAVQGPEKGTTHHASFNHYYVFDFQPGYRPADAFGQPIYAVADGIVALVVDEHVDLPFGGPLDPTAIANRIVVRHPGGVVSVYVHNKQHSAKVIPGQAVKRGDQLAEVGHSGHTGHPHLHFEVRRDDAVAVPVRFSGAWKLGEDGRFRPSDDLTAAPVDYATFEAGHAYSYEDGSFVETAPKAWEQRLPDGSVKARFTETGRADAAVLLFDASRKLNVKLPLGGGPIGWQKKGAAEWKFLPPARCR